MAKSINRRLGGYQLSQWEKQPRKLNNHLRDQLRNRLAALEISSKLNPVRNSIIERLRNNKQSNGNVNMAFVLIREFKMEEQGHV